MYYFLTVVLLLVAVWVGVSVTLSADKRCGD
jgi:hypothetical protein